MKILGIKHSKGTYQDKDYDNTYLYCVSPFSTQNAYGYETLILKCKSSIIFNSLNIDDLSKLINLEVIPYYDKFGNVIDLKVK